METPEQESQIAKDEHGNGTCQEQHVAAHIHFNGKKREGKTLNKSIANKS